MAVSNWRHRSLVRWRSRRSSLSRSGRRNSRGCSVKTATGSSAEICAWRGATGASARSVSFALITTDCVIGTQPPARPHHTTNPTYVDKIVASKAVKGIDTWFSDCYLLSELAK